MRTNAHLVLALLLLAAVAACRPAVRTDTVDDRTIQTPEILEPIRRQLLLVTTADWDSVQGTLTAYSHEGGTWQQVFGSIPIVVGKNGMAWGLGTEDFRSRPGPVKQEGDLRSPAGMYDLVTAFGYADSATAQWVRLPYVPVGKGTMCIEDTASAFYNRIVEEHETPPDWNSTDHMRRKDDLYEWGVFVGHNEKHPTPGGGSCIFLHIWRKNDSGTAGCTAMAKQEMVRLLEWLDPETKPILVQVPRQEYTALQKAHQLPELP